MFGQDFYRQPLERKNDNDVSMELLPSINKEGFTSSTST